MWELIRQNRQKSLFVLFLMFILMESFSILIFYMFAPETEMIAAGALFGLFVWAVQALVAYFFGDKIVLTFNQAVVVDKNNYPRLFNVVEEMRIAGSLPSMPEIYLVEDKGLNAFATGIRQEKSAICVTRGLYEALNRDELQGVIAHEMSHILNRDVLFMTFAGVMLGTITMLSNMVIRGGFTLGKKSDDGESSGKKRGIGVRGNPAIILIVIAFAILAPLLAKLFYFTISRKREFLADASAARLTRYPEGLASALEKISNKSRVSFSNRITSPMFIISPEPAGLFTKGIFSDSTHPPVSERIMILRKLQNGGSISLSDYRKIYLSNVKGRDFFPDSAKNDTGSVSVRAASPDEAPAVQHPEEHIVEFIGDSTPSDLFKSELGIDPEADQEFVYTIQKPDDWESFRCPACGKFVFHLAPNIRTRQVVCRRCKKQIKIEYPE
ncbi:M48 family metallopeptidase [bacterium]|nr:M48 family metallopeptidase [bacterium]